MTPALLLLCALVAQAGTARDASDARNEAAPFALVLGTAQDGGLPQIACTCSACEAARADPARRRLVTSLLVVDPRTSRRWLLDATPDLREQVERARGIPAGRPVPAGRPPLFEGIFLTHAHIGHYAGLEFLGREAYAAEGQPVHATESMAAFLRGNGPWSQLVATGAIRLEPLRPGEPIELAPDLSIEALPVPHRHEFSDTVAFVVRGPHRSLLYLPDIDKWERWETMEPGGRRLEDVLRTVDVALLDGTFFGPGELPGRDMDSIPHPFVVETLARLAPLPASERAKVLFTHLNHSNPIADPESAEAARVRAAGMGVAAEGARIVL